MHKQIRRSGNPEHLEAFDILLLVKERVYLAVNAKSDDSKEDFLSLIAWFLM